MRFASGEYYHIYNRGVEKRDIFLDENDYQRFLKGLSIFNLDLDKKLILNRVKVDIEIAYKRPSTLASIICYVLMKNHIHLLVRCNEEVKLSKLLQKIFIGYTMYFNAKYNHSGVLFQGRSRSKHIDKQVYLSHLFNYIHLNHLDYSQSDWRTNSMHDIDAARKIITEYPWSSLGKILSSEKDPILDKELIAELFPNSKDVLTSAIDWSYRDLQSEKGLLLEDV